MKFEELTKEEFSTFAKTHPLQNFHQTTSWGDLKKRTSWESYYVGMKDKKGKILCASLLLAKDTPIKRKMFYAPRGFLIDFEDQKLLSAFTEALKTFIKEKKGFFLKIDPYLDYQERDIDGNIVENGFNHQKAVDNLIKNGYKHYGFNLYQDTLQPRWMFTTTTKDRSLDDILKEMDPKTRQVLHRNERLGMTVREIKEDELDKFKKVMEHTSNRREFIDRPFSYYKNMFEVLGKDDMIKVLLAELDIPKIVANLEDEKKAVQKEKEDRLYKKEHGINQMNEKKFAQKQKEDEEHIARLDKKIKEMESLSKKHGDVIVLGGILFLIYGKEVLSLVGGSYQEFMEYNSAYTVHYAGLKYAWENHFDRYNFYGITGDFSESNPYYGLYLFKRGFGGQVEELIGEFDLIISKPYYYLYKVAFGLYHKLKSIKAKIQKKNA